MTPSAMHDARDAEDTRLLAAGEHKLLVAGYFHWVRERCFVRLRDPDAADEAAQRVFVRLLGELRDGKTYRVPYRVVVLMVTEWTIKGQYPAPKSDAELPADFDGWAPDDYAAWEAEHDLGLLLADLPPVQRSVAEAIYRDGLAPREAAERLEMKPNAVHQALHNAHRNLRPKLHV
jgi:DNA-directed RNA polymerase specialized sigma24 family protein